MLESTEAVLRQQALDEIKASRTYVITTLYVAVGVFTSLSVLWTSNWQTPSPAQIALTVIGLIFLVLVGLYYGYKQWKPTVKKIESNLTSYITS